jgi:hypothetical protein
MSSNSSNIGTSSFSQLIARLLLEQVLNTSEPTASTRSAPVNTNAPVNICNFIIELSRQYTESINEYNANIAQYNRTIDRIIQLLEHEIRFLPNNTPATQTNMREHYTNMPSGNINESFHPGAMDISNVVMTTDSSGIQLNIAPYAQTPYPRTNYYTNTLLNNTFTNRPYSSIYINSSPIETYNRIVNSFSNLQRNNTQEDGLTEAQIQNATFCVIFDESNNEMPTQCHITLDEFKHGEELLQIRQCKHTFKPTGLRRWLSQHSKCPVCRCNVTLNNMYPEIPPEQST